LELSLVLAYTKFNGLEKPAFARAKLKAFPLWRGIKGEDYSTSRTKTSTELFATFLRKKSRKRYLFTFF
jgi:hypothetical protein